MDVAELKIKITTDLNRSVEEINKVDKSLYNLNDRLKKLKSGDALFHEKDVNKIKAYNKEIQDVEAEIRKLTNAGKKGFDELGNAVQKNNAHYGKAHSSLARIANIIPGIGVGGLIAFATGPIIDYVESLMKVSDSASRAAEMMKLVNGVVAEANKEAGTQVSTLKLLYAAATNVNLSLDDRLKAVKALKDQFPTYFKDLDDERIMNGKAKESYDQLAASIIASSRAKAAKAKIDELEAKRLDIDFQKQKINTATANEKARAKNQTFFSGTGGGLTQGTTNQGRVQTKEEAQAIIEKRRQTALALQEQNDKILRDQISFLTKFATLPTIVDVIDGKDGKKKTLKTKEANLHVGKVKITKIDEVKINKSQTLYDPSGSISFSGIAPIQRGPGAPDTTSGVEKGQAAINLMRTLNPELKAAFKAMDDLDYKAAATATLMNEILAPAFDTLFSSITGEGQAAFQSFGKVIEQTIKKLIAALLKAAALTAVFTLITGGTAGFGKGFMKNLPNFLKFAEGGSVNGPGSKTSDSILARLSTGEYVIKADSVSKFGKSFFDMLNGGKMPKFASGGFVGGQASMPSFQSATSLPIQVSVSGSFRGQGNELLYVLDRATATRSRQG